MNHARPSPASVRPSLRSAGDAIKDWRHRRRLSQLDLAAEAGISTRHLSFLETGRSSPSREMVLRLAERLAIPIRERNGLLVAAGFAPLYPLRSLDDPALAPARRAMELVLKGHEPFPALAVDRHWNLVAHNDALLPLLAGLPPELLAPPVNVLRLSLQPAGLAPRIVNYFEWRSHLLERLQHQVEVSGDAQLRELLAELSAYPAPPGTKVISHGADFDGIVVPLRLRSGDQVLSFISTTTVFGTPVDVTVSELALETFFPADEETAAYLRAQGSAGK